MDSESYESKRKQQNRQAQRRYRQKQKHSQPAKDQSFPIPGTQMEPVVMSPFGDLHNPCSATSYTFPDNCFDSPELISGYDGVANDDFATADLHQTMNSQEFLSNYYASGNGCSQLLEDSLDGRNESWPPTSLSSAKSSGSSPLEQPRSRRKSSSRRNREPEPSSSPHAILEAKAMIKITELAQLYELGVEMDILGSDSELEDSFETMKEQFRRCAGQDERHYARS